MNSTFAIQHDGDVGVVRVDLCKTRMSGYYLEIREQVSTFEDTGHDRARWQD